MSNGKRDDNDADDFVDLLKECSGKVGVKIGKLGFCTVKGDKIKDWEDAIDRDIKEYGKMDFYILFVQKKEQVRLQRTETILLTAVLRNRTQYTGGIGHYP